jgi:hypothetical protein
MTEKIKIMLKARIFYSILTIFTVIIGLLSRHYSFMPLFMGVDGLLHHAVFIRKQGH